MLIFARRVNLIAHRFGWQVHAQQDAKFGLFTNAVRVELGEITAPGLARFHLKHRFAVAFLIEQEIGDAINPAIAALLLVNPRLIVRIGKDRPFLEFLARFVILAVGEGDSRDLRMLLLLLDLLICLLKVNLNWFNQPNCFGRPTPRHFETFARAG